jgi:hypothetical protein
LNENRGSKSVLYGKKYQWPGAVFGYSSGLVMVAIAAFFVG